MYTSLGVLPFSDLVVSENSLLVANRCPRQACHQRLVLAEFCHAGEELLLMFDGHMLILDALPDVNGLARRFLLLALYIDVAC